MNCQPGFSQLIKYAATQANNDHCQLSLQKLTIDPSIDTFLHTPCNQVLQLQGSNSPSYPLQFSGSLCKDH